MSRQILSQNNRIFISNWESNDFTLFQRLYQDKEMLKYIGGPQAFTAKKLERRFKNERDSFNKNKYQYFPIFTVTGDLIGCCGLREVPKNKTTAELGFHLPKKNWGQGYAKEAAQLVIEYAKKHLTINTIQAGHHPKNIQSKKILLSLGFVFARCEYYEPTGLEHPTYILSLYKVRCKIHATPN